MGNCCSANLPTPEHDIDMQSRAHTPEADSLLDSDRESSVSDSMSINLTEEELSYLLPYKDILQHEKDHDDHCLIFQTLVTISTDSMCSPIFGSSKSFKF